MKRRVTNIAITIFVLASQALSDDAKVTAQIKQLEQSQQQLRAELNSIRSELKDLRILLSQLGPRVDADDTDKVEEIKGVSGAEMLPSLVRIEKKLDQVLAEVHKVNQGGGKQTPRKRPAEAFVGKKSPAFLLQTTDNTPISNETFSNYIGTVLNFVAPNCGYCAKQIPMVETLRDEFEPLGFRFILVSQTMGKQFTPEEAVDKYYSQGAQCEMAIDDGNKVGRLFKATAYPTLFIVGEDGTVKNVTIGAKSNIDEIVRKELEKLLK